MRTVFTVNGPCQALLPHHPHRHRRRPAV